MKHCPINDGMECKKEKCAWWDINWEECGILTIAKELVELRARS